MHTPKSLPRHTIAGIEDLSITIARTYTDRHVTDWHQVFYVREATAAAYLEAYLDVMNHGVPADAPPEVREAIAWKGDSPVLRVDHATAAEHFPHTLDAMAHTIGYAFARIAAREANARMCVFESLAASAD